MSRIVITPRIALDTAEIGFSYLRASGPGGQRVNKVETAVQLRFDLRNSPNLDPRVKHRVADLAGTRLTIEGVIVIFARAHASQERNRAEAQARLVALIAEAAAPPKPRIATKPTRASDRRRFHDKQQRGATKRLRGSAGFDD